jgi:hypothetical protein
METALQKGLICVVCTAVKTRAQVCRQCFNALVIGQQAKPETLVVLALKHLLGETVPFSQGVHLGGSSCAFQIDGKGCNDRTKGAFPDMAFRLPHLNLYIEIDEHCHRFYEASCEAARLDTIQYGVKLTEGERLLPSILLRFNPHSTKDGGCDVPLLGRIKTLAQRYRDIVDAPASDTRFTEFANMSVQYMFYGSDVQHRSTLDRAQATVTVLDNINAECLEYHDDVISKFQFADIAPEEINNEALKAVQETLDESSSDALKRCSAMSHSGKGNERQCTGYPVKGTELCARHTKSALAKQVRASMKRERE